MSLSAILEAIRSDGEAQFTAIEKEAYTQSRIILAEAQGNARDLHEKSCASMLVPAYHERARILHRERLEALRITGDAREGLLDAALSQARGRLATFRNHAAYAHVLGQLVRQALNELQASLDYAGRIELQADPRDQAVIQGILAEISIPAGADLNVTYNLTCWGGVIAKNQEDSVVVINTLEARLDRATPYLRRSLSTQFEA